MSGWQLPPPSNNGKSGWQVQWLGHKWTRTGHALERKFTEPHQVDHEHNIHVHLPCYPGDTLHWPITKHASSVPPITMAISFQFGTLTSASLVTLLYSIYNSCICPQWSPTYIYFILIGQTFSKAVSWTWVQSENDLDYTCMLSGRIFSYVGISKCIHFTVCMCTKENMVIIF